MIPPPIRPTIASKLSLPAPPLPTNTSGNKEIHTIILFFGGHISGILFIKNAQKSVLSVAQPPPLL